MMAYHELFAHIMPSHALVVGHTCSLFLKRRQFRKQYKAAVNKHALFAELWCV